jgi:monoamine oxidase
MSDAKIAIVGAGISGMSAVYHLQQAGFSNLKIFEGLNRIGGRIETRFYKGG